MENSTQATAERRLTRQEIEDSLARAFYTLDLTAQAINRLETFTFGLTKLLKDKKLVGLEELDKTMKVLVHHEDLGDYWDCNIEEFKPPASEEEAEAEFDQEFEGAETEQGETEETVGSGVSTSTDE